MELDYGSLCEIREGLKSSIATLQADLDKLQADLDNSTRTLVKVEVLYELAKRGVFPAGPGPEGEADEVPDPVLEYHLDEKETTKSYREELVRSLRSHTVSIVLKLPETDPYSREWIFNMGQRDSNAHHWLYNPSSTTTYLQFGSWGGSQCRKAFPESFKNRAKREWVRITATYDSETTTYKVFLDGDLHDSLRTDLAFRDDEILIGEAGLWGENNFSGRFRSVKIWNVALTDEQVQNL